jgi:hypothetical protein
MTYRAGLGTQLTEETPSLNERTPMYQYVDLLKGRSDMSLWSHQGKCKPLTEMVVRNVVLA